MIVRKYYKKSISEIDTKKCLLLIQLCLPLSLLEQIHCFLLLLHPEILLGLLGKLLHQPPSHLILWFGPGLGVHLSIDEAVGGVMTIEVANGAHGFELGFEGVYQPLLD